jgi:hypothetical protein
MRSFWSLFLLSGLLVTALSVLERRQAVSDPSSTEPVRSLDDGSGMPPIYPTPKPTVDY